MPSPDVALVRLLTDEPGEEAYTDQDIIDRLAASSDVYSASASIWREKAAAWAGLVDTSEAGASLKLSDLHKQALAMAVEMDKLSSSVVGPPAAAAAKVFKVVRT